MKIYKSANDRIVLKRKLKPSSAIKKIDLVDFEATVMSLSSSRHVIVIYICHLNFKLL